MRRSHELYAEERFSILSNEHVEFVNTKDWVDAMKSTGIYICIYNMIYI